MHYRISIGCLAILLVGCSASVVATPARPADSQRHTTPEQAVQAYFTASDQCSSRLLRSAFHPAAHMQWIDKSGALHARAQLSWWRTLETANPCTPAADRRLQVLDREGPMALVEAYSRFGAYQFHDFLLAVDGPQGWVIADKVFQRLDLGESPAAADEGAVRRVIEDKIAAAGANDPALLASSHVEDCIYSAVRVRGVPYARESVSQWAARYAERRERGEDGRAASWRVLRVGAAGTVGYAKLEVVAQGTRYVDHLLLLRTEDGWRVAAAVWGDPAAPSGAS